MIAVSPQEGESHWGFVTDVTERILDLLLARANYLPGYGGDPETMRAPHRARVARLVRAGQPIAIVLPAFPAKSPNPEKTLGKLPDFGEVLALRRLEELCRAVEAIYRPGARLTICSDGRVFGDLVRVTDAEIDAYGAALDGILVDYGFSHLRSYGLEHVFPGLTGDEMRDRLVREYARPVEDVREKVLTRDDYRQLFNGIHRFLFEDGVALTRPPAAIRCGSGRRRSRIRSSSAATPGAIWSKAISRTRFACRFTRSRRHRRRSASACSRATISGAPRGTRWCCSTAASTGWSGARKRWRGAHAS